MNLGAFLHMTILFWVMMDAVGTVPIFVGVLKHFEHKRQRIIIIREMTIALGIMILFLIFGQGALKLLNIDTATLQIAGGTIIFLIALRLLFSHPSKTEEKPVLREPMIVPLAVPSIAGPGILAAISLWVGLGEDKLYVLGGILIAWGLSLPIVLLASLFKKFLGDNGLIAVERLFGYLIALISIDMAINGFVASFK
jgi:small neutral amino acid transporter SnatA (MarC family)